VDAHKAQNRLVSSSAIMKPDGKAWSSFSAAQKDGAPAGYVPIALSQPFHALDSLDKALEGTDPSDLEHEAITHGLDLNARLTDTGQGRWGLVDPNVLKRINEHTAQISSNPTMRGFKMATTSSGRSHWGRARSMSRSHLRNRDSLHCERRGHLLLDHRQAPSQPRDGDQSGAW